MNTLQTVLALVFAGAVVLDYFRVKRYLVFFLIKTRHGIRLLESVAGLAPGFWRFCADAAVAFSFGGLGGAYLAKQGQERNLYLALFFYGFAAVVLVHPGWVWSIAFLLGLAFALNMAWRASGPVYGFCAASVVGYLLSSQFISNEYLAVLAGVFGAPGLLLAGLGRHALDIVFGGSTLPGVSPLVPASRGGMSGVVFPGYNIFVPWWFALIALTVTLLVHEGAHGVVARLHRVRVKSTGILTAGFLPIGAFVEPDEGDLGRKESLARMRVFAAGSFANFVAAFCAGGLILAAGLWFSSVLVSDGMEVVATVEGYPAHGVLVVGDVIKSVDGRPTSDIEAFRGAVEPVKPGESVVVETDRGNFSLITTEFPGEEGNAYVGIEMVAHQKVAPDFEGEYRWLLPAFFFAVGCLYWTAFFNVNIAFVNLLPVVPFDGWRMLGEVLGSAGLGRGGVGGVSKDAVMVGVLLFTLLLFAVNVYPLLLMLG